MKRILAAAAVACLGAAALAADPLEGTWQTALDDNGNFGFVQVVPCGPALCGTLTTAFGPDGARIESPSIGRQINWETVPQGGDEYAGRVYAPDRDRE